MIERPHAGTETDEHYQKRVAVRAVGFGTKVAVHRRKKVFTERFERDRVRVSRPL